MRRFRFCLPIALTPFAATTTFAQQARITYPQMRTVDAVDSYGSVTVPDPFRWLEDLDSKEVADWVRAENAVTRPYLAALPRRDAFRARITALYNYARTRNLYFENSV